MALIRVFIGFYRREAVAFNVLSHSIQGRSSMPVAITPLMLSQLGGVHLRERHPLQSTDFSFFQFLTPYLSSYQGFSIFMGCNMLMLDDIAKLWSLRDDRYAVHVVRHDHRPCESRKFLGEAQSSYDNENWSSVVIFSNEKCYQLTPDFLNSVSGLTLPQFRWRQDDKLIGDLPRRWNQLVGYDSRADDLALVRFTRGGPCFAEHGGCEYADEWRSERRAMAYAGAR